jgi:hypothetical protein
MARHRTRVRIARSLRAVAVAAAAAGTVTALFEADMGRGILLSSSTVAFLPPALYLVLGLVLLRGAPLGRRLGWAVAACGVNAALALASGLTLSLAHPMSFEGAMRRALWAFAPGPLVHLVAAPLVLLAWRSRVVRVRVTVRSDPEPASPLMRAPAPPLAPSTPDWDSVLRTSPWSAWKATAATVFDRNARRPEPDPEPEPARPVASVPMTAPARALEPAPAAPPLVALPASAPAVPVEPGATPVPVERPSLPLTMAATMSEPTVWAAPEPAPGALEPGPAALEPELPAVDEPVIRVPFDRIADQLPPDVFVLPPERLAESVREPHVILIPSRLVLPQLGEGAVEVPWTLIDDQFPDLALAMPKIEVRRRFPSWVLSLPLDVVVGQIPAEVFRLQTPAIDLFDISQFPAPFQPGPPATVDAPPPEVPVRDAQGAAGGPVLESSAVRPPPMPMDDSMPVREDERPATPPPLIAPRPAGPEPDRAAAVPSGELDAARISTSTSTASSPSPTSTDEEAQALGRTLALGLVQLGALDWQARRIAGQPLVSFVHRALSREAIDALALGAASLARRLASWGIEQVTIRTARVVCVLTPLGTRGWLAVTVRRGGPVAMLEMLSTQAGRAVGDPPPPASPAIAFPAVATTPAAVSNGHRAVAEAASALGAFGPFSMSLAEAEGSAPSVYVFGGQDQAVLAGAARVVHAMLVAGHDPEVLGRLDSVMLRRGRERAVLRPLRGAGGRPAVLAAAGEVALVGQAQRAVAQAAMLLEAR